MRPYFIIFILFVTVIPLLSQETKVNLGDGDRVEIILTNENSFRGSVTELTSDYITIDISLEYKALNGTITIEFTSIKTVTKLLPLSAEYIKKLLEEKGEAKKSIEKQNEELKHAREAVEKGELDTATAEEKAKKKEKKKKSLEEAIKGSEEMQKSLNLLSEFPPGEEWNEEKYKQLKNKFVVTGMTPTETEQKFLDNYELWKKGAQYMEESEKAPEEEKSEGITEEGTSKTEEGATKEEKQPE